MNNLSFRAPVNRQVSRIFLRLENWDSLAFKGMTNIWVWIQSPSNESFIDSFLTRNFKFRILNFAYSIARRGGETGRRTGLKIQRGLLHAGSIPAPGTKLRDSIKSPYPNEKFTSFWTFDIVPFFFEASLTWHRSGIFLILTFMVQIITIITIMIKSNRLKSYSSWIEY